MDLEPEELFIDDDDLEDEFYKEREFNKECTVYLVDASPKMFYPVNTEKGKQETFFHVVICSISSALKTQIINKSYDEIAICFFNTREKKNLQDSNGVFVFNVPERENLDRPTARLIKEFHCIEGAFSHDIGSKYGIISESQENSIYNALWCAQALLRKGSSKTTDKRIIIFTNEDNPFGSSKGAVKKDMVRTTIQRAKDAQDLGITIEVLPLIGFNDSFDVSLFYADLLGLVGDDISQLVPLAGEKLEDMKDQLRKRMFKKRKVRRITFSIVNGLTIELNTYALIRPTSPGAITWLDSVSNLPLKSERSFICADTGALIEDSGKRLYPYKGKNILISVEELSDVKTISPGHLCLLGFKPLHYLKDYHNLKPSTFVFPSDEEIMGSTCIFIALHRSMLRLDRFAVAFYGGSSHPQLVALVAQNEITCPSGQIEPPGMHMIFLPYSDDIRHPEEFHMVADDVIPQASAGDILKACALLRRMDLKDFSVCQFANPALQRHYAVLEALALGEDEIPEIKDETLPDVEGMSRPGVVNALKEFKDSVYGPNHEEEEINNEAAKSSTSKASRKRRAIAETATRVSTNYEWVELADNGKLKDLTVVELKYYLAAHNLPVTGKKEALISRILTHMGK